MSSTKNTENLQDEIGRPLVANLLLVDDSICKFPYGDQLPYRFCGREVFHGRWCKGHLKIVSPKLWAHLVLGAERSGPKQLSAKWAKKLSPRFRITPPTVTIRRGRT